MIGRASRRLIRTNFEWQAFGAVARGLCGSVPDDVSLARPAGIEIGIRGVGTMSDQVKPACISRRTVLIAAAGAAPLLALGATGAQAAKMSQAAVRYQATPKDGKQCDGCNLFIAPNACKSVDGTIAPTGWCALWVKKAS